MRKKTIWGRILVALLAAVCLLQLTPLFSVMAKNDSPRGRFPDAQITGESPVQETDESESAPEDAGGAADDTADTEPEAEQAEEPEQDPAPELPEASEQPRDPETEESVPAEYSDRNLTALLRRLADELALQADDLIDWLFDDNWFTREARVTIFENLSEDGALAESFFAATRALYDELQPNLQADDHIETVDDGAIEDILDTARTLREAMAGETVSPASDMFSRAEEPAVSDLTRTVTDALDSEGEAVYRHYVQELGFTLGEAGTGGEAADIVLLIDNSISMDSRLSAILTAAEYFVTRPEVYESGSRVAVVTFSDEAETLVPLTAAAGPGGGPNGELVSAIRSIGSGGQTNLQAGLIEARDALGMDDSSVADDGRTRAVVLMSDGISNRRVSDIWRLTPQFEGSSTFVYDIDIDWDGSATGAGAKRWSYLVGSGATARVYLDGTPAQTGLTYNGGQVLCRDIAMLEAQYLVSQGVDLFAVDYGGPSSSDPDYLHSLTLSLDAAVDLSAGIAEPAYAIPADRTQTSTGSRVYSPADEEFVDSLIADLFGDGGGSTASPPTLTDTLDDAFVFDGDNAGWTLVTPDGQVLESPDNWTLTVSGDGGTITLTGPGDLSPGRYTVRYPVRVRDDAAEPLRYYPDGGEADPSRSVSISYSGARADFASVQAQIPPLLRITGSAPEYGAIDEDIPFTGEIVQGNGDYTYAWYLPDSDTPLMEGAVSVEGLDPTSGLNLEIPVPELILSLDRAGSLSAILQVTDTRAHSAGYSGGQMRVELQTIIAGGGRLTIQVVGQDGASYGGLFEATIRYTGEDGETGVSHFMGPGTVSYDLSTGLRQGTYTVSLYVPYGYAAVENEQTVEIALVENPDGTFHVTEQTVTIQIEHTRPGYFFDWTCLPAMTGETREGGKRHAG